MEGLRWWLLLLTALMFSMSGCASHGMVPESAEGPYAPSPDAPQAALPSMDMTGKWRGTWVSRGLFGDERSSEAHATFSQSGKCGFGRIALAAVGDTIYGKIVGAPAPTVLVLERE